MSDASDASGIDAQRAELAAAFDREIDPLAEHSATFDSMAIDPFELYITDVLDEKSPAESTMCDYRRTYRQWCEFMETEKRHPACPNEHHVKAFALHYRDVVGNNGDTVEKKLLRLTKAYEYWQNDPAFPHPHDYNPFELARSKLRLDRPDVEEPPRIPIEELAQILGSVTHIRDRAIITTQLKLGLRAGEVCNLQLQDIHIGNAELQRLIPELGTHEMLNERENAVYIPTRQERNGNKSRRPRVLPIDNELRLVLIRYLLTRPDTGEPWVFLSKQNHNQLDNEAINNCWIDVFHPEYAETARHRAVTSHFGRHRFTTYWQVEQDVNRELVKYMRGDTTRNATLDDRGAIDEYIHTYYEDIDDLYRERIYRFNI